MGQQIVELAGALADQMREHLALLLARQIGAGRRRGQVELRCIAGVLGHVSVRHLSICALPPSIARRSAPVKGLSVRAGCMDARSTDARALIVDDHGADQNVVQAAAGAR
mgnify:CR=1 FL=1